MEGVVGGGGGGDGGVAVVRDRGAGGAAAACGWVDVCAFDVSPDGRGGGGPGAGMAGEVFGGEGRGGAGRVEGGLLEQGGAVVPDGVSGVGEVLRNLGLLAGFLFARPQLLPPGDGLVLVLALALVVFHVFVPCCRLVALTSPVLSLHVSICLTLGAIRRMYALWIRRIKLTSIILLTPRRRRKRQS